MADLGPMGKVQEGRFLINKTFHVSDRTWWVVRQPGSGCVERETRDLFPKPEERVLHWGQGKWD